MSDMQILRDGNKKAFWLDYPRLKIEMRVTRSVLDGAPHNFACGLGYSRVYLWVHSRVRCGRGEPRLKS